MPNEGLAPIAKRLRFKLSTGVPTTGCFASKFSMHKGFLKEGYLPTFFSSFLYFDLSLMVWFLNGLLGAAIANTLHLDPVHDGLMVVLAGAALWIVLVLMIDR